MDSSGYNKYNSEFVQIGGIITNINLRYDKKGNQWAILTLDTLSGIIQVYVWLIYMSQIGLVIIDLHVCKVIFLY